MSISHGFKKIILMIGVITSLSLAFAPVGVGAIEVFEACDTQNTHSSNSPGVCGAQDDELQPLLKKIVNFLLYILGAVAVIVIIISGITFVVSGGDSSAVIVAKNRLLYAVIGLVVAIMAYAIVNFVLKSFK